MPAGVNNPVVDVVVPVYNGFDVVRRCIESVLAVIAPDTAQLLVVDDASTDPSLVEYLAALARDGKLHLLRNQSNKGFVCSANVGLSANPERDVILLNSDTEVRGDWITRLRSCAYESDRVGTVTPFSNNATICSFPRFCSDNALPGGVSLDELDDIFRRVNRGRSAELPTAVGFCMYVRRACLAEVGLFDEARFGRGYGEENDFCRRALRLGWTHRLCADVFVFHSGSASFQGEREVLVANSSHTLRDMYPDYFDDVRRFIREDPLFELRQVAEIELVRTVVAKQRKLPAIRRTSGSAFQPTSGLRFRRHSEAVERNRQARKPVQLHIVHDLGGGVERWCRDFCAADTERLNLILKPYCRGHAAGEGLVLFDGFDRQPVAIWIFSKPFEVTEVSHPEYLAALTSIVLEYDVRTVIVSSLIGHTLDVLTLGLPTAYVVHDYFPFCPAINMHFGAVCSQCDEGRLRECVAHNADFNPFLSFSADERLAVRRALVALTKDANVIVVAPTRVAWRHVQALFPPLATVPCICIPHGDDTRLTPLDVEPSPVARRFRVMVLGMLSANKGLFLLESSLGRLTEFADVYLVGAREVGELFRNYSAVQVIPEYTLDHLDRTVQDIRPDVGLLLSIWPETYSYTLTELMKMAIPPVATNLGAFAERIIDGETGYLISPHADKVCDLLVRLSQHPDDLARVRANLAALPRRSVWEMVVDYHRAFPVPCNHEEACRTSPDFPKATGIDAYCVDQAWYSVQMWKKIKSLDLQLAICRDAHPASVGEVLIGEHQRRLTERQLGLAEHQRAVAEQQRAVAEQQRALAEIQCNNDRARLREHIANLENAVRQQAGALASAQQHSAFLADRVGQLNHQIDAIQSSTSWRATGPIRLVGTGLLRARFLWDCVEPIKRDPETISRKLLELPGKWRAGGLPEVRRSLLAMRADEAQQNAWRSYLDRWNREVRPHVLAALEHMKARPLISVVVPTFNTRGAMLRQMLDSVLTQIYPDWELCIADDCSTERHVRRILEQYARDDARIRLSFSTENRGVSAATNRAIAMATGQLVVLLDHDDILEAQALFRVAQSIIEDDPDMVYSDEVLMSPSMKSVLRYAHRPAFSPELLRSHPYIVHMVGFRRTLLAEIGGFDESLRISQDYDLILRASEAAKTVVHIPEILYRWRIHGGSAGTSKMQEVMETSKRVLTEHMKRRRLSGHVDDGPRFNLFDSRYDLSSDPAVAVIIPTKNHGDLVRQCIDSIRATVSDVRVDIIVVDHDSDDPATCAYFKSIAPTVKVLRYSGPFNFSAINNWAVKQIAGPYSHYLFCNNDIEARESGWLGRMMELCQQGDVGVVGAQLLYPDGQTIQHAGVCVGAFGAAEHFAKFIKTRDIHNYLGFSEIVVSNHEVSAVTAACLLIRHEAYEAVGGFDEALAVGFGDVDLCLRVGQLGFRVVQCPHAVLIHHESFTRGKTKGMDPHPEDSRLFQARWQWFLAAGDPYFNPALYQNSVAWQVRKPMICDYDIRRRIYRRDETSNRQIFSASARQGE